MIKAEVLGLGWEKFKENLYPFFTENSWIVVLWGLTATMDAYSTTQFMAIIGPEYELHPLTRACSYQAGIEMGPYISGSLKFLIALPLLVCYKREAKYVLAVCCIFQFYAFHYNMDTYEYLCARVAPEFWFR